MEEPTKYINHLIEGVPPIMVCVGSSWSDLEGYYDFKDNEGKETIQFNYNNESGIENVNYFEDAKALDGKKQRHSNSEGYVISNINSKNKLSRDYQNCVGTVVSGLDRETGENISFLSHQNSRLCDISAEKMRAKFIEDFEKSIHELKEKSMEGTTDAIIFGGYYPNMTSGYFEKHPEQVAHYQDYPAMIKILNSIIKKELGFEPTVAASPKRMTIANAEHAFYENATRRLYLLKKSISKQEGASFGAESVDQHLQRFQANS